MDGARHGGPLSDPAGRPASTAARVARLILAVARNAVGIVGLVFFGWSPASLAVLYFADTLAGMGAVFAAVGFKLSNADPRRGFWTLAEGVLSGLGVAAVLVAVVAVPLGIPLVFVLGSSRAVWREMWADPSLAGGLGVIALTGLVAAVQHVFTLAEGHEGEVSVKQAFAVLMTRWVLVLIAIYTVGALLGRFGLYVVVLVYAAVSVWSEVDPERFARLIRDRRAPESS